MKKINILKEFNAIYNKGIRKQYDIGNINMLHNTDSNYLNPIEFFIKKLNPINDIHISQPFNLIITNKKNEYFKEGWKSIDNIDKYFFFGHQNEIFLILNLDNNNILAIMVGDSEPTFIASSFEDFILFIIEILKISNAFLIANDDDDDYFILEDEDFLKQVEYFISQSSLNINKDNIFKIFFS